MGKKPYARERNIFILFPILITLSLFMMLTMSMRAAAESNSYFVTSAGISESGVNADITNAIYNNYTLTLNNANIEGTLTFPPSTEQGDSDGSNPEQYETHYTIYLTSGTKSTLYNLTIMENVIITIKGEGELYISAPEADNDGAPLQFGNDPNAFSKLIIEGGTVTFDANFNSHAIKGAGCLYVKNGAESVTIIGQTHTNQDDEKEGVKKPIIPDDNPNAKIFSDYPCRAEYIPSYKGGKEVNLSTNGTSNGSSDKTISDTSILRDEYCQFHKLVFKPGYTVIWRNDDANNTVLEEDKFFYWAGQEPEYNGAEPTKEPDDQYSYTFSGWSPKLAPVYADTVYKAVYTKTAKAATVPYDSTYTPAPPMASSPVNSLADSAKALGEYEEPSGATYGILKAQEYEANSNSITIGWKDVSGAVGYAVYGAQAGMPYQKLADVTGTGFKQEGLVKGASYKYFVAAYDADGNILVISRTIHVSADKNNPKSISLKKNKASLSAGGTFRIKAAVKGGKGQNAKKIRFESSNPAVATVSANGTVTAVSPGNCTIYVFAQNGISKKCKIKVK